MVLHPNAKINIGLNVVERRDDGYHNIETVFYPIGLTDVLEIQPSSTCSDYSFSSSGIEIGGDPEDNLIVKAYRLLQYEYALPPVDISLCKQIPFGAGLGGGSSDAAFMIKGLNELFDLKISKKKMEKFASLLGADCPVFINNKPVYATGIGNVFSPIKLSLKGYFLLLVKPDIHVSTPLAYSRVTPCPSEVSLVDCLKKPINQWREYVKNDFEKSVFAQFPVIEQIKEKLYQIGALYASMSGSGSAVYGIFESLPADMSCFEDCFVASGLLD